MKSINFPVTNHGHYFINSEILEDQIGRLEEIEGEIRQALTKLQLQGWSPAVVAEVARIIARIETGDHRLYKLIGRIRNSADAARIPALELTTE